MSRFVIVYRGAADPSAVEESSLLSSFKASKVLDRMPGSILVEGSEAEVAKAVQKLGNWTFAPEKRLGTNPPHKKVKQIA